MGMLTRSRFISVLLLPLVLADPLNVEQGASVNNGYGQACQDISSAISSQSGVFYPGNNSYNNDTSHWAISSSQHSACSVEPGNAEDIGKILKIVGKSHTPFAVKSGGHNLNPGFSSTPGVQISMNRFNEISYDSSTETVEFGSGLVFDDVYAALAPYNRSVAGGRVVGIGVGGFLLGGGYAWQTNQYGLGIDSIVAYELVKPDGQVAKVTAQSDAELFFGLKGGLNNFGVVTRFTLNTLQQPAVWGGTISYPSSSVPELTAAIIQFSANNNNTKANISPIYSFANGSTIVSHILYYDGPSPPAGLFDDFLRIPSTSNDVHERNFTDFINSNDISFFAGFRGVSHTVPLLEHSPKVMAAIQNETSFWGQALFDKAGFVGYTIEPFLPSILSHNATPTAYPPTRDHVYFPLNIYFGWLNATYDNDFYDAIRQSALRIRDVAIEDGQDIASAPLYPNYAIFDTPLMDMYGANVDELHTLRKRVDPDNLMGLMGGFRV